MLKLGNIPILNQKWNFKLKDKQGRSAFAINNQTDSFMVIKGFELRKVPGENNKIEVVMYFPDPSKVEVIEVESPKEEVKKVEPVVKE